MNGLLQIPGASPKDPAEDEFCRKMKDRVLQNFADIMPDDRFMKIVDSAVHQALLAPRTVPGNHYSGTIVKDSYLCEMVRDIVDKHLSTKMDKWFSDNKEKIEEHFKVTFEQQLGVTLFKSILSVIQEPLLAMQGNISNRISEIENRRRVQV